MTDSAQRLAQAVAEQMQREDLAIRAAGIEVLVVGPGHATTRMTVLETMINSHRVCHGGFVFLLADAAFAYACNSHNVSNVAAGCQIEFVRAAWLGEVLEAKASQRHAGRRGGLYDIEVYNERDQLVAAVRGRSAALNKPVLEETDNE